MSFQTELLAALGNDSSSFDINAIVRRCFFYDFDGYPTRLWHGVGNFFDSDGNEWLGTIDANGNNVHRTPAVKDAREGTSPRYEFGLPHLDQAAFDAMKADQALVQGRNLTCYHVIFRKGEGVRPQTPIRFSYRLKMQGTRFEQGLGLNAGGSMIRTYSAFVLCRTLEFGRSKFPGGTYTDVNQNERAALLGESSDSGCVFVAGNARRTYVFD